MKPSHGSSALSHILAACTTEVVAEVFYTETELARILQSPEIDYLQTAQSTKEFYRVLVAISGLSFSEESEIEREVNGILVLPTQVCIFEYEHPIESPHCVIPVNNSSRKLDHLELAFDPGFSNLIILI